MHISLTDNANRAIQQLPTLHSMQVALPDDQLVVKFVTNASTAMWLQDLVTESISGSVVPLAMFTVEFTPSFSSFLPASSQMSTKSIHLLSSVKPGSCQICVILAFQV